MIRYMIKNTYIYPIVALVIVGGVVFWMVKDNKTDDISDTLSLATLSPSPVLSPSSSPTSTLTPTPRLTKTPKPSSGIVAKEVDQYKSLVDWLDPLNRRLTLDRDCTSIVPSQVAYPNNTQIMLDNTLSPNAHVLKIGSNEYSLSANGWLMVTLSSSKLPAYLTMFCGPMELGQIDLQ